MHLILVGDGPEHDRLATQASERGVADRIHLVGRQEDVGNWLAMMDIYLNVSQSEGMSQSILEAMAAGLPMVVTDVGDNAFLVDGEGPCGRVVPFRDARALSDAVNDLLVDPQRCLRLGAAARRRHADQYTVNRMTGAYEALYAQILADTSTASRRRATREARTSEASPQTN